jgi:CubicO group peptidase (beta-lactamase class C family)
MEGYHLNLMPTGEAYFGGGAYLRPRDMLKLGQLYLSGGTWGGRRVVSKEWVARSLQPRAEMEAYFGVEHKYGYGWHLYRLPANGRMYSAYGAGGNGGQMVIVVPDLDLVVATTGGAYGEFKKWYRWLTELIPQHVLAAAK